MNARTTVLTILAIVTATAVCTAQWNADPAVGTQVRPDIFEYYEPIVVPSDSGHTFVLWGEYDTVVVPPFPIPQNLRGIRLQRITPTGEKEFGEKGRDIVFYENSLLGSQPRAIPRKDGGILISLGELFTQIILALDRNGDTVWTYAGSLHGYEGVDSPPYMAPDGQNGLFIVPEVHGVNFGEHQQTRVFRMDSTGTMAWSGFAIADSASPICVAGDGMGNVYIGTESEQRGVFLNKVDSAKNILWGSPSRYNTNNLYTPIHNFTMQIVDDGSGGAFTTWINGNQQCVIAHISTDGVWSNGPVGLSLGRAQAGFTGHRTSMIKNSPGQVILAWESYGDSVLVQCFDTTGAPLWNNGVPTYLATGSVVIAVVRNTPQTVIVFYSHSNGNDEDIFAKMLSNDGQVLWNMDEKPISTAPGDQMAQSYGEIAIPHLNGGAFIAWKDYRDFTVDIYCTAIDGNGNNLPVEFLSFSASLIDRSVLLQWRTAAEQNNAGFRVQRSVDGINWREMGFVPGAGTASDSREYTFTDPIENVFTSGLYYRLRQEDYDGTHAYSPVQYVALNGIPTTVALHGVYPNPASGDVTLGFTLDNDYPVLLAVYSVLGTKMMDVATGTYTAGSHLLTADVGALPDGMYFLRLTTPAGVRAVKMRVGK